MSNPATVDSVEVKTEFKDISSEELYDMLVEQALSVREEADNLAWRLGEIALNITEHFGTKALKDFASAIRFEYSTLRRYRDVSKSFQDWRELTVTFSSLSWSHFRCAAAQPNKMILLERACDESWSCEKMRQMTKPEKEEIIDDGQHVPPRPELVFDLQLRLWYIGNKMDDARYVRTIKELQERD